jgi:Skp family chaperone for outer membrane proteins
MPKTVEEINIKDIRQANREIKVWRNHKADVENQISDAQRSLQKLEEEYTKKMEELQSGYERSATITMNLIQELVDKQGIAAFQIEEISEKVLGAYLELQDIL